MNLVVFLVGSTAPLLMGALSDRYGVRGFEVGFVALGGAYALGGESMLVSARFFFKIHRVKEP